MGEFWRAGMAAPGFRHAEVLPELSRRAESELRRLGAGPQQRPFFLYVALPSPHSPLLPSAQFRGLTKIGSYGDYVAQTDAAIGRLTDTLDDLNIMQETLLIVTSDNGPFWYAANVEQTGHSAIGPWRGMKGDAWEGGHRVPLIVRWPGNVPAGATSDVLVSLTDFLVTIAALTGVTCDAARSDGVDFSPASRGHDWARPASRPLMALSSQGSHVLRNGRWKYIDRLGSGGFSSPQREKPAPDAPAVQLYDLANDPRETSNVAAQDTARVRQFEEKLAGLLSSDSPARP
jgi:arylsulfatase A-like enzyme